MATISDLHDLQLDTRPNGVTLPVLFIGHGSPMNAIEDNAFSQAWLQIGSALPQPQAILCISAHWETNGTRVTAAEHPETIHDFYGFPGELSALQYPAPGSPEIAGLIQSTVQLTRVSNDLRWGLDHGAWSVLCRMFPKANIPVVQFSLDRNLSPEQHYSLGQELKPLRKKNVLIIASGNIVHNLRKVIWEDVALDWAEEFDARIKHAILTGDHESIIHFEKMGEAAHLSVPTLEHFLPLLYILAMQDKADPIQFFTESVTLGSMSMRSIQLGM